MNETEKDRILRMVSEGILQPGEAAQLLAAVAAEEKPKPEPAKSEEKAKDREKQEKQPTTAIQMQRPDGTNYTIEVPPHFMPMLVRMVGVAVRESARTAAQEAWSGLKTVVRDKATEVTTTVRDKVTGGGAAKKEPPALPPAPAVIQEQEARGRILQMVQNGRLSADEASRLIQQLDALKAYAQTDATPAKAKG
jgi:polyhydroxyalkanoate synthesis regulator phasin